MNRGVLQSHGWWSINTSMRPPTSHHQQAAANSSSSSPFMAAPPPPPTTFFPHFTPPPPLPFSSSSSSSSSWSDTHHHLPPSDSWSQLLLGGLVDEEDKSGLTANMEATKKLENWEEQLLGHGGPTTFDDTKHQESSCYNVYGANNAEFAVAKQPNNNNNNNWSQSSSPTSCVTTLSCASNMLDSCNNKIVMSDNATRHPPPDHSSECNSTGTTGGAPKKPRVQPSSTTQSTFKVRKEKLGDRITALHQLVSPFGKTDTASVLLEAIGYIRFLQSQIEALSLPYLGTATETMRHHQPPVVQGERSSLFPEDPGQLLNDNCMKRKGISHHQDLHDESKKDLRSRGLCLVPISCTLQVGNDNGADYWAPAAFGGGFR